MWLSYYQRYTMHWVSSARGDNQSPLDWIACPHCMVFTCADITSKLVKYFCCMLMDSVRHWWHMYDNVIVHHRSQDSNLNQHYSQSKVKKNCELEHCAAFQLKLHSYNGVPTHVTEYIKACTQLDTHEKWRLQSPASDAYDTMRASVAMHITNFSTERGKLDPVSLASKFCIISCTAWGDHHCRV